jgi:drug/metabolite transporter (DMT)-like permease
LIDRFLSNSSLLTILVSGLAASAHFGFWIWSLNHTSLAHSLFFVSTYPLVVVAIMLCQRKRIDWLEGLGVIIGLIGSALLLTDTSSSSSSSSGDEVEGTGEGGVQGVTFVGDLMAFLGAVVFIVYLYAGQRVREWMPLFLYTFPMTLISAIPLLFLSLAIEPVSFSGFTPQSVFGFLAPSSLAVLVLIAILPAGLGHTGINYAVKKVSPLSISVVLTLEPVLGVVVGVVAGVETVPGVLTMVGGPVSMIGCIAAIVGTYRREQNEKAVKGQREREETEFTERADQRVEDLGEEGDESDEETVHDGDEAVEGVDNDRADSAEVELVIHKKGQYNGSSDEDVDVDKESDIPVSTSSSPYDESSHSPSLLYTKPSHLLDNG